MIKLWLDNVILEYDQHIIDGRAAAELWGVFYIGHWWSGQRAFQRLPTIQPVEQ